MKTRRLNKGAVLVCGLLGIVTLDRLEQDSKA